ncbi:MAG TPA: 2,3-bisphosphoglycerate-independent phosphoglycerate mutase, partial [Acidobacteriota bacterium]
TGPGGTTPLEAARTPNLDRLAAEGAVGLQDPVYPGITPGSGPGHLGLFGYDPLEWEVGRGVLETLGIGFDLTDQDLAGRGNFCSVDQQGRITDRRAGRIGTEQCIELCRVLDQVEVEGVEIMVRPVREHRFAVVFRGPDLDGRLADTDPQKEGVEPLPVRALAPEAQRSAERVQAFIDQAAGRLRDRHPANMLTLRGLDRYRPLPRYADLYRLSAAAIAVYPMYRGVARLAGMDVLDCGSDLAGEFGALEAAWQRYDFFFVHVKKTDSAGEDGNFELKAQVLEQVDELLPRLTALRPQVLAVTGDHSTPCALRSHSWHPVPLLIWGEHVRRDQAASFGESACAGGGLGRLRAKEILPLLLAHARKLKKFGA